MFNNIIVGYDGSEGSRVALDRAVELMKLQLDTKLVVAYVNEDVIDGDLAYTDEPLIATSVVTDMTTAPSVDPDLNSPRQLSREYAKQMTEFIQMQFDKHHINGQIIAIDGHPVQALCKLASEQNADAILVGNSGKSGFQKFFVGSVSEKLVKDSPCSVVVVK